VSLALTLALAWSLGAPAPTTAAPTEAEPPLAASASASARPPEATTVDGPAADREIAVKRPRRLASMLSLVLAELRTDGSLAPVRLDELLRDGTAVFNIWATYCEPCMRELAVFRAIAREPDTRDVRFVFAMSDQLRPNDAAQSRAHAELREVAAGTHLLVDPADDVNQALRSAGVYAGPAVLPLTLVTRCGEVAWGRLGEISQEELRAALAPMRRLGRCERARGLPTATPATEPTRVRRGSACGDQACDRLSGETCETCPADCGCPAGSSCTRNAAGRVHCASDESVLKE
jgi:thiol-disulfide isomerase/thioredoxin